MVQDQDFDFDPKTDILKTLANIGPDPGTMLLKAECLQPPCPLDTSVNALLGMKDTSVSILCNTNYKGKDVSAATRHKKTSLT